MVYKLINRIQLLIKTHKPRTRKRYARMHKVKSRTPKTSLNSLPIEYQHSYQLSHDLCVGLWQHTSFFEWNSVYNIRTYIWLVICWCVPPTLTMSTLLPLSSRPFITFTTWCSRNASFSCSGSSPSSKHALSRLNSATRRIWNNKFSPISAFPCFWNAFNLRSNQFNISPCLWNAFNVLINNNNIINNVIIINLRFFSVFGTPLIP